MEIRIGTHKTYYQCCLWDERMTLREKSMVSFRVSGGLFVNYKLCSGVFGRVALSNTCHICYL